ncbi:UNVERIFIED_CONTAM: hypothetical protein Slati_0947300 [Sesamum latifolium]|uniref:Transposase n=1 Tax=Sesamum latifolium TaxID=2727402 RepID=A0AAW2XQT3_9LAMI
MIEYPSGIIEYCPPVTPCQEITTTMKKLIKDLGLPVEKIAACKNGCMLYWKDDVDLEYCKFCGDARYKPTRGRDPRRKKSPYAVLRYLPLIPRLQRLYCSRSTAEHMTWHATHQTEEGSNVIHLMPRRGDILTWYILILQKSRVIFGLAFAQIVLHHTVSTIVLIHVDSLSLHHTLSPLVCA